MCMIFENSKDPLATLPKENEYWEPAGATIAQRSSWVEAYTVNHSVWLEDMAH